MIKLLRGDDVTHVVAINLPEAAYADGVKIEFKIGDLTLLMPAAPRVVLNFPSTWTAIQSCGRLLGSFSLISPTGQRGTITKTYPVYITDDVSAVGTAGSISGNIIPAIDFSDLPSLDATSTHGDTKAVLNEILRRLKACCITLAIVLVAPFLGLAAEVKTAPLDDVAGTMRVVTNVNFAGLAMVTNVLPKESGGAKLDWEGEGLTLSQKNSDLKAWISPDSFYVGDNDYSTAIFSDHIEINGGTYYADDGIYFPYSSVEGFNHDGLLFPKEGGGTIAVLKDVEEVAKKIPTNIVTSNDLATVKSTIPEIVTNVVRDIQGLVYDEKLNITWKQTMYDGNLYYIAVTNANITEVK